MIAGRTESRYEWMPLFRILTEMVERYDFSRDGGEGWIAGIWRGFPVLISLDDEEDTNSLAVTMGIGEKYPTKESMRGVHASKVGNVNVDLFSRKGFLCFTVQFKKRYVGETNEAFDFLCLLLDAVADSSEPPPRICGWCDGRETDELTIDRGMPRRMCEPCWEAYLSELNERPKAGPNYFRGMLLGAGGALAMAISWAFLLHIEQTGLLFLFTPFVGIVIAWMVLWGMERGDRWAHVLSGFFSMTAGVFGTVLELAWRAGGSLETWGSGYGLDEILTWISENRGEALSLGVFICISVVASITTTKQLLASRLVRVGVPGGQAGERDSGENRAIISG